MSVTVEKNLGTPEAETLGGTPPIAIENLTVGMLVSVVHTIQGMNQAETANWLPHLAAVRGRVVRVPEIAYIAKEKTDKGIVERNVLTGLHIQPLEHTPEDKENGLHAAPTWALAPGDSTVFIGGYSLRKVQQRIFFHGMDPSFIPPTNLSAQ